MCCALSLATVHMAVVNGLYATTSFDTHTTRMYYIYFIFIINLIYNEMYSSFNEINVLLTTTKYIKNTHIHIYILWHWFLPKKKFKCLHMCSLIRYTNIVHRKRVKSPYGRIEKKINYSLMKHIFNRVSVLFI